MRFTPRLAVLLTVLVLSAGALALEPFTLGPVYKLGTSTTASLPASSATIEGGLIYDTDTDSVKFNNGSAWAAIGGGGESYWYDAGAGYIFAQEAASNPDGGAFTITARGSNASGVGPAALYLASTSTAVGVHLGSRLAFGTASGAEYGSIWSSQMASGGARVGLNLTGGGAGAGAQSIAFSSGSPGTTGTPLGYFNPTGDFTTYGSVNAATTVTTNSASGARGYWSNTGAWADLGGGGSDYLISDGTGIETPGYLESTQAITTGPGLIAPSVQASGAAFSSFTSTNRTALGAGNVLANTTIGELWQSTSTGFKPFGTPHNVIDRQTLSTRLMGTGKSSFPQIAERIACDTHDGTGATVQTYMDRETTATTTGASGRTYSALITADAATRGKMYTACSSAATTLYTSVYAGAGASTSYSSYCQAVGGVTVANSIAWVLMANAETGADATTLTAAAYGFRYAASVDGNWYACYYDGTNHCTTTGVAVGASTEQVLCTYQIGTNLLVWTINGAVTNTAAAVSSLSNATPMVIVDSTSGVVGINVGVMSVESL